MIFPEFVKDSRFFLYEFTHSTNGNSVCGKTVNNNKLQF